MPKTCDGERCASPTAAEEVGEAQKTYTNLRKAPSGKRGRRLGEGALLGEERDILNAHLWICASRLEPQKPESLKNLTPGGLQTHLAQIREKRERCTARPCSPG